MILSISPSLLGSYEYVMQDDRSGPERQEKSMQELLASIRGERTPPNEAMLLGRAWHEALGLEVIGRNTVTIDDDEDGRYDFQAESLRAVRENVPADALFECWGELVLEEIDVVMRLRADALSGLTVHEFKTKGRGSINPDTYNDSAQWRCYLLAFDAEIATYHVTKLKHTKKVGAWFVTDYEVFTMYGYPGMRADVVARVRALRDFIFQQGLGEYRRKKTDAKH